MSLRLARFSEGLEVVLFVPPGGPGQIGRVEFEQSMRVYSEVYGADRVFFNTTADGQWAARWFFAAKREADIFSLYIKSLLDDTAPNFQKGIQN
jgi:hypothetical protein